MNAPTKKELLVWNVCAALQAEGTAPTIRAVGDLLEEQGHRRGSNRDIAQYIRSWRKQADATPVKEEEGPHSDSLSHFDNAIYFLRQEQTEWLKRLELQLEDWRGPLQSEKNEWRTKALYYRDLYARADEVRKMLETGKQTSTPVPPAQDQDLQAHLASLEFDCEALEIAREESQEHESALLSEITLLRSQLEDRQQEIDKLNALVQQQDRELSVAVQRVTQLVNEFKKVRKGLQQIVEPAGSDA